MKTLPERIYVGIDGFDSEYPDDGYLVVAENLNAFEDSTPVGIYQLVEAKTLTIKKELV